MDAFSSSSTNRPKAGNRDDEAVEIARNHRYTPFSWLLRLGLAGALLAWMGLIFYVSSLSQEDAGRPLESPVVSWLGVLRSYAVHLVLYGVLASLAMASIRSWTPAANYQLRWVLAVAAFATLYGVSDEYHQSFVPGRYASLLDMLVNGVGAATATLALWLLAWTMRLRSASTVSHKPGRRSG